MAGLVERNQVGKREDLADIITCVDAKATPFFSMVPKDSELTNPEMQWPVDNYPEVSFDGVPEDQDVTTFENFASGRAILHNYIQIFERKPKVSRLAQNLTDVAGVGRKKEMARATAKGLTMIKRDIEAALCSDHEAQADDGTVGYRTRGLGKWIDSSAQSVFPVDSNYRTPTGSLDNTAMASLTETVINNIMESAYGQHGNRDKVYATFCGTKVKRKFTEFTIWQPNVSSTIGYLRTYQQDSTAKISNNVDVLEGDFGTVELHPSLFLAKDQSSAAQARRAYFVDMDMVAIRWNKMPDFRSFEDKGGGPRGLIEAILGLVVRNPLGLGKLYATT